MTITHWAFWLGLGSAMSLVVHTLFTQPVMSNAASAAVFGLFLGMATVDHVVSALTKHETKE